ncbi:MAG TPA: 2Fe-2S iron-sulfur cluster-binding protein [Burkholderiaceae bacterium]|nr:2Fe-2S iron-sulfur cluster-binding protein [Burkholderiaceae bacterium]
MLVFFTRASDDAEFEAEAKPGMTLLRAAQKNGIDGFLAECGGNMTCGTCHAIIDPAFWSRVGEPTAAEEEMLGFVADERQATSRLACQVRLTPDMDGLRVRIPARQM